MRRWPAFLLVTMTSACGAAANDIVATDSVVSHTATNDNDPSIGVGDEPPLLSAAGDSIEPYTVAVASPSTSPASTSPPSTSPAQPESEPSLTPDVQQPNASEARNAEGTLGGDVFDLDGCPDAPRGAVTDKANQRYWLCMDGHAVTQEIPMTTASSSYGLPPVGTYPVFARDQNATGINGEPLERFVAFYTTPRGNRIAFHEVVDQDPATVGDLGQRGSSAGCFRIREADSIQVWEFLQIGDPVVVLTA